MLSLFALCSKCCLYNELPYEYLKIIPNKSVRNNQTARLLEFVAETYIDLSDRIEVSVLKMPRYTPKSKFGYYIYLTKQNVEFYFIVRQDYTELLTQRINDVWKNLVTIEQVESIPKFERIEYYIDYKYEDALSLKCDNRDNDLIGSILNATNVMRDGDSVGLLYNFSAMYQKGWISKYCQTMDKIKNNTPYYKNKFSGKSILFWSLDFCLKLCYSLLNVTNQYKSYYMDVSDCTRKKKTKTVIQTQIVCAGNNKNAVMSVCDSFQIVSDDNSLEKHKSHNKLNYEAYRIKSPKMITSTSECQNFVSLPGEELLKKYKIEHIDISECKVPEELQRGYIRLGINTYHGIETPAYLMDHIEHGTLPVVLLGEQGAAKTTTLANFAYDAQSRRESVIVIDFIKNNEMCDTIKRSLKGINVIDIDLSDVDNAQGIGYNELKPKSDKAKDIVSCANQKALYISRLIDSIGNKNNGTDDLSSRMDKYLTAASNVVMVNESASLRDVVKCLNDYIYRDKCIKGLRKDVARELTEEINDLRELDEKNTKTGKIDGTKYTKIDGVNDRISKLRKDYRLKKMFNSDCKNNIDLIDAMESGKVILFRMPQSEFPTSYSRNVIVTYLLTKIWSADLVRGAMHKVPLRSHIIIDEIFQAPTAMDLINNEQIIPQTRKFQTQFMLSAQYKKQIEKIFDSLHNAGASYLLMKGSGKSHFDEFKDMIAPFTLDDMQALKQYHSLNIINTNDGRKVFETSLPKPL